MKTKLLFAFIALSLLSCSDDDSSATPSVEKNLEQMVVTKYQNNGTSSKDVYDFDDQNRLEIINRYNGQNEYFSKTTYEYNEAGLLSVTKTYGFGMGDPNQPSSVTSFNYDSSLRIIGIDDLDVSGIEGTHTATSFTYNANNTITAQATISGPPEEDVVENYTFYLNAEGRIVKKLDSEGIVLTQAVFENYNLLSYTQLGTPSMAYLFNTNIIPKGQYLNIDRYKYGGSFNNPILNEGFSAVSNINYISQHTSSMEGINLIVTYTYEFDEDGYPIKVSLFKDGSSQPYEVREISYQ